MLQGLLGEALAFLELIAEATEGHDRGVCPVIEGFHVVRLLKGVWVKAVNLLAGKVGALADPGIVADRVSPGGAVGQLAQGVGGLHQEAADIVVVRHVKRRPR